ncbi:hypothetical protein C8034_v011480 [Colletotrichum sidae]|uniref:Uncharacterized protein n=1 Tax=Colletotrichum sidae TaxID=1347389 RepID=A0A4R8TIZ7_9PEZI|nr:hypothetical protein C8034_v011480 [Colletotrichum sidae]
MSDFQDMDMDDQAVASSAILARRSSASDAMLSVQPGSDNRRLSINTWITSQATGSARITELVAMRRLLLTLRSCFSPFFEFGDANIIAEVHSRNLCRGLGLRGRKDVDGPRILAFMQKLIITCFTHTQGVFRDGHILDDFNTRKYFFEMIAKDLAQIEIGGGVNHAVWADNAVRPDTCEAMLISFAHACQGPYPRLHGSGSAMLAIPQGRLASQLVELRDFMTDWANNYDQLVLAPINDWSRLHTDVAQQVMIEGELTDAVSHIAI